MSSNEAAKLQRIKELLARDEAERPLACTLDDVPAFYECITPEWLTAVVRRKHPDAMVSGYTLGERDSGTTNRRRIFLEYPRESQNKGYPASFFCKAAQDLANRITMSVGSAVGEVRFYNEIRGELPIDAPDSYFAAVDPDSFRAIIVLKDMAGEAEFCNYKTPMPRTRAESQIELLAKMHGHFYESPALSGRLAVLDLFADRFKSLCDHHGMDRACDNGLVAGVEAGALPKSLLTRRAEIWPKTMQSLERMVQAPQTLQHGDVHLGNWYVRPNDQMGLTDFQNVTRGHWSRDLAYAISTALTIDNRRAWERDLIALYLDLLQKHGGQRVSFDDAWNDYRQQLLTVLAYWTVTLTPSPSMAQDMHTKDTTLEFLKRIGHAIEDVETLNAF